MATAAENGLPRELAPGIHWVTDCITIYDRGRPLHAYSSAYLVEGDDASLLVDTGHPRDWDEIVRQLDILHAKGAPPVKYIVPTHSEVPHAANLAQLLERYPDARCYGDIRDYHLIFPEYMDRMESRTAGDRIDLGRTEFVFVEAVVKDLVTSVWGYSTAQRCLFPGDGFAYMHHHHLDECGKVAEECPDLTIEEFTALFAEHALYWTKFTDMDVVIKKLDALLDVDFPVDLIAPGHGNPVLNPSVTFPRVKDGLLLGASITN
jgi:flavorubredoxin